MSDTVIKVQNLSKCYRLGELHTQTGSFREKVVQTFSRIAHIVKRKATNPLTSSEDDIIWAIRNVSFEVKRGEILGIIGRNGAGKSTLLKILSRITKPTEGKAWVNGRVGSLLEVGTGFHPELTGRENIFLNGAIIGMSKAEIKQKFDKIVDFAEIEKFIDTPVKRYSSGMYVRLAFAVAAHLEPDILLVDEVLAVGDALFQKKCLGKIGGIVNEGRTVLFVSHNMAAIKKLCSKSILLNQGRIIKEDVSNKVIAYYLDSTIKSSNNRAYQINQRILKKHQSDDNAPFVFIQIELLDKKGTLLKQISTGDPLRIRIHYHARKKFLSPGFMVSFKNRYGIEISRLSNMPISGYFIHSIEGDGVIEITINELPFLGDVYFLSFAFTRAGIEYIIQLEELVSLKVTPRDVYKSNVVLDNSFGIISLAHLWKHSSTNN